MSGNPRPGPSREVEGNTMMSTYVTNSVFIETLTTRERQVAEAIARGLSNKQIGVEFGISHETVKRHLASIYSKLALPGRVALAIHVVQSRAA
jgi:DNA-binding NarL/FixJ family response regulator